MADEIKNNMPEGEEEEESNIVELTDEDGVVTKFEYLATIDHEGSDYVVLMVMENEEGDEADDEGEVVILKIGKDDKGEDIYVSVDDDNVAQAVFDKFEAAIDEEED